MSGAVGLDRIDLNVRALQATAAFLEQALGFTAASPAAEPDVLLAGLLGARGVACLRLRRGAQVLQLTACDPPGAPIVPGGHSNDVRFQHCALVTTDMGAAYARLCGHAFTPISRDGPQTLPGGIVAFKFRAPEGHPLELIQFPKPRAATADGIDHSAVVASDTGRSIAFYAARLGLTVQARQVNTGEAQDRLDGLNGAEVDVVALAPPVAAPHVELLGYRSPPVEAAPWPALTDLAATRLVFTGTGQTVLMRDPDGHALILLP